MDLSESFNISIFSPIKDKESNLSWSIDKNEINNLKYFYLEKENCKSLRQKQKTEKRFNYKGWIMVDLTIKSDNRGDLH